MKGASKMQQRRSSTGNQENRRIWLAVGTIGFSLLLFFAVAIIIVSQNGFKNFYQNKVSNLDSTSVEAIMPASQESDKVYRMLEQTDHVKIGNRDGLMADSCIVKFREKITTNLTVLDGSNQDIHCTVGALGTKNSIVLPYIFKSLYGFKTNQMIQFLIGDINYIYKISGFYEDAILSQQEVKNRIVAYVDAKSYTELQSLESVVPVKIMSLQLSHPGDTNQVLDQLKDEFAQELFIGGLDLELYGGQDIASNVNLYVHYVKMVSLGLGILFLLIAMAGLVIVNKRWCRGKLSHISTVITLEAAVIPAGCIAVLFGAPWLFSRLITSLGYTFQIESAFLSIALICLLYALAAATITILIRVFHKADSEDKNTADTALHSYHLLKLSGRSIAGIFTVSLILATTALVLLRIYSSTLGDTDLFYEYNENDEVIEVFHTESDVAEESHQMKEITDYAKPVIQAAMFGGMIALGLIYAITVYQEIARIIGRLKANGEINLRRQALPILGMILAATLAAFLLGLIVSCLCQRPVVDLLRQTAGISIEHLVMNQILILMLFGGASIIAGGVTLGVVR